MKSKRMISACALVGGLCLLLSACGQTQQEEVTVSDSAPAAVVEEPVVEEEPAELGTASLLTNEDTGEDLTNIRPLAVMIENTRDALPHYGLADAGIVYEMPEEGGITRYMALYDDYEGYDRLGNIRSTRPYYVQAASEYDAIIAHIGQSSYAKPLLRSLTPDMGIVDDINGVLGNTSYITTSDKVRPHNTYLTSENIINDMERNGIVRYYDELGATPLRHFMYADDENLLEDGDTCEEVHVYFYHNKPYFIYDEATKLYTKYEFGSKEPDALSSDGLTFDNLIIQEVDGKPHADDPYIDLEMMGTGTGKFITRGKMIDITWYKEDPYARTMYFDADGNEIQLNTGKTYIAVCEKSGIEGNTYE